MHFSTTLRSISDRLHSPVMKKLGTVAAIGAAAVAARRYLGMREAVEQADPQLRSVALPFVTVTYSAKTLPVIRLPYRLRIPPGPGVNVVTRTVGQPATRLLVVTPDGHRMNRPPVPERGQGGVSDHLGCGGLFHG